MARIVQAAAATTAEEGFVRRFADFGLAVRPPETTQAIEAYLAEERGRWRKVIEERGLTLESVQ